MGSKRELFADSKEVVDSVVALHCCGIGDNEYSEQLLSREELIEARTNLESALNHLQDALKSIPDVSVIEPSDNRMTLEHWRELISAQPIE